MNFQIHLSIANALKDIIEEELSIKVNRPAFFYGSVKPDLFPNIITASHEIKYSKEFIENEVKNLLQESIVNMECSWKFSETLGIIMHYLSDFFCYAHSEFYKGSMWEHYCYEVKHSKYFIKNFRLIIRNIRKADNIYLDLNCFKIYIEQQYENYISKSPSAARDLIYSLKICSTISLSIIASVSNEFQEKKNNKENILLHSA